MTNPLKLTLLSATLAAFLLPVAAQTAATDPTAPQTSPSTPSTQPATPSTSPSTPSTQPATPRTSPTKNGQANVGTRKLYQQDRISKGIANGSLTAGEANSLEKQESNLNHEEVDMRKMDNGKLTGADKAALEQQQNKLSKEIYQDKHNSATQNQDPTSHEGKRAEHQQDRIAQGVKDGQLTPGEASQLENKESAINREVAQDRKANGGRMTAQERAQVNAQQNRVSKQIYRDKHNRRTQK